MSDELEVERKLTERYYNAIIKAITRLKDKTTRHDGGPIKRATEILDRALLGDPVDQDDEVWTNISDTLVDQYHEARKNKKRHDLWKEIVRGLVEEWDGTSAARFIAKMEEARAALEEE